MKTYTVYRVDSRTNRKVLLGKMVERRMEGRSSNLAEMFRLALSVYRKLSIDSNIFIINESVPGGFLFGGR